MFLNTSKLAVVHYIQQYMRKHTHTHTHTHKKKIPTQINFLLHDVVPYSNVYGIYILGSFNEFGDLKKFESIRYIYTRFI